MSEAVKSFRSLIAEIRNKFQMRDLKSDSLKRLTGCHGTENIRSYNERKFKEKNR